MHTCTSRTISPCLPPFAPELPKHPTCRTPHHFSRLDFGHPVAYHVACEHQMNCTLTPWRQSRLKWGGLGNHPKNGQTLKVGKWNMWNMWNQVEMRIFGIWMHMVGYFPRIVISNFSWNGWNGWNCKLQPACHGMSRWSLWSTMVPPGHLT